ncbi:MAG: hypothetical protein QM527_15210 [Alphaproteobacteria bacterium]|nr:hypothetical protein [Alphaproteobacteria bacterium]
MIKVTWLGVLGALCCGLSCAQSVATGWQAGLVLDTAVTSAKPELASRDKGAGLGHSDLLLRGPVGEWFSAEIIGAFHTVDQRLETHWENAWVQTRKLPAGWQVRAGRFAPQVGYWNEIHPHADDFAERGLLQRAFFGGHWVDDGLRVNWTAPTPFYLRLGAEWLGGRKLVPESVQGGRVSTYGLKVGNDWGPEHSWQWGLTYVKNGREALPEEHEEGQGATHAHAHGAKFSAKEMWVSDLVWKWAPGGNPQQRQLRVVWEWAQEHRALPSMGVRSGHSAQSLGLVWRFDRDWETGVRLDHLNVHAVALHESTAESTPGRLRENSLMLAYKPSHRQTWRLQVARQTAQNLGAEAVFARPAGQSLVLQYILGFGAHGAHSY